jgi:ribosomal-protein-alanine N-acetyltransferase
MINIQNEQIETQRMLLRVLTHEQYDEIMSSSTDSEIINFFGFTTVEELEAEKDRYQKGTVTYNRQFLKFHFVEKQSGEIIGSCDFHTWAPQHARAELGYSMNSDAYKNKGYMKEALGPIIRYGFEKMKLHRIEALTGPDNIPSIRLIEHFGFTKEAVLREHYFVDGKHEDTVAYSLLKSEFIYNNCVDFN